jgi:hypothetical protein
MNTNLPTWALEAATPPDRARTQRASDNGTIQITWPANKVIREWAKQHGWPTPWFGFKDAFIRKMLDSDDNFALAVNQSDIQVVIPIERYTVSEEQLREFDALYEERGESGRPTGWGILVAGLREIRRLVEAGIIVEVDGRTLKSFGSFYNWAHGRYHMLEDGYDSWIGDDNS